VEAQLLALFEYYPLVARGPDDFRRLTDAIASGGEAPALRAFLLRRCVPGPSEKAGLGAYMQAYLAGGDPELEGALAAIIQNPTEEPAVQLEALRALGPLMENFFAALLARDPQAAELRRETEQTPHVRTLIESQDAIPL